MVSDEIRNSQIDMSVIQDSKGVWNAVIRLEKCAVGKDPAALFGGLVFFRRLYSMRCSFHSVTHDSE
jgi:hypothetical protein